MALAASRAASSLLRRRLLCTASTAHPQRGDLYRRDPRPSPAPASHSRRGKAFKMGPYEIEGEPRPVYPKRRSPLRRSTALIKALNREESLRMVHEGRAVFPAKIPDPRSGDIIRVTYVPSLAEAAVRLCFTGICMAVRNNGVGSTVVLRNVVDGVPVERGFPMYSPLIVDAEVIGKRKVRRAKLYYLREKPLRESTIPDATKRPKIES